MRTLQKKTRLAVYCFVLAALLLSAFNPLPQKDAGDEDVLVRITQVDTSEFPSVTVYLSVVNSAGEPVGIDPARLRLMENGKLIPLNQVQGVGESGPQTTMLVIDVSGSMNSVGKLDAAKAVGRDYVSQLRSDDQAGLIIFNTEVTYTQPITKDHERLLEAIDGIKAQGDTAMYDALMMAVNILNPISGRKAIIVLTDGLDNSSKTNADTVIESIGASGLSISTVGLGEPGDGPGALSALDEPALTSLAERAGGRYGFAKDQESLSALYDLYRRALQSEYVITYLSPSTLRDGVKRSLSVSLMSNGESGAAIQKVDQTAYNPGGLVPEVASPAPWSLFGMLLAGLLVLLFVPSLAGMAAGLAGGARRFKPAKKPRIKLK